MQYVLWFCIFLVNLATNNVLFRYGGFGLKVNIFNLLDLLILSLFMFIFCLKDTPLSPLPALDIIDAI